MIAGAWPMTKEIKNKKNIARFDSFTNILRYANAICDASFHVLHPNFVSSLGGFYQEGSSVSLGRPTSFFQFCW